jgi:hypothetical protein
MLPYELRAQGAQFGRGFQSTEAPTRRSAWSGGFGLFRQPVVRSGDAVRRPAAQPLRTPFPVAESLLAPVSPSLRKDAFLIGDSNRNANSGFVVTSFHGTRSHDRDTRVEWIQSLGLVDNFSDLSAIPLIFLR